MSDSCPPSGCHANFPPIQPVKTAVNSELADYWDTLYSILPAEKLEWYEEDYTDSLKLVEDCNIEKDAHIMIAGCGNSGFIQKLLDLGYNKISAVDISQNALDDLKENIGDQAHLVNVVLADFTNENILSEIPKVDLWFDRMLLHHFVEPKDLKTYTNTLSNNMSLQGKIIVIANGLRGNNRSAGLPVKQLSSLKLKAIFPNIELISHFEKEHTSPTGKKNFLIYGVFVKGE